LIVIKNEKAFIYKDFPLAIKCKLKVSKQRGDLIYRNEIIDISEINFSDAVFDLNINNGDKFVWLFRVNWRFGLYFDFTRKLKVDSLYEELGNHYRYLQYLNIYSFIQNNNLFEELIEEGWFPFIQLISEGYFQKLIAYFLEDKKYLFHLNGILRYFNEEKIDKLSDNWWKNEIICNKRKIIEAGISAYFLGTDEGYINSIKTLSTEIEGILRVAYFSDHKKNPSTKNLKDYISSLGAKKFNSVGSLGFPGLFYEYLDRSLFKGFDLKTDAIPISRHSVAHGVAGVEQYTKIKAFQLILVLDQISFFLSRYN
jgi:hypothetical protein